jgi:hypothetical protein
VGRWTLKSGKLETLKIGNAENLKIGNTETLTKHDSAKMVNRRFALSEAKGD